MSPVFDLIKSLSHQDVATGDRNGATISVNEISLKNTRDNKDKHQKGLGDFGRLWDFLGVQRDVPVPSVPTFEASIAASNQNKDAYASDGALYYPPSSRGVRWRDEAEGENLADTQPDSPPGPTGLTKAQRKKRNRKARLTAQSLQYMNKNKLQGISNDTGSGDESANDIVAPARLAGVHAVKAEVAKDLQTPSKRYSSGKAQIEPKPAAKPTLATPKKEVQANVNGRVLRPSQVTPSPSQAKTSASSRNSVESFPNKESPKALTSRKSPSQRAINSVHESLKKQWPAANHAVGPLFSHALAFAPVPGMLSYIDQSQQGKPLFPGTETVTPTRKRHEIIPLHLHTTIDRNWSLLLKLLRNFPSERNSLLSPLQLSINCPQPTGIHVFVDASNIIIGFLEHLKRARGIPNYAHVPLVDLSFHALALLLERRRPVAKRVLAGSTPEIPAFEEARQVGYETCILDKVFKSKELTERQRRFAARGNVGSGYTAGGSGSDTAAAVTAVANVNGKTTAIGSPPQQPKWVEQAVDEILHLKLLESIVDTHIPALAETSASATSTAPRTAAPTMVLATGDAAEAEYSPGFMKMVERALLKGWNVEVAAWSASVSMGYRRMEKAAVWGERFKIIELDDYSEELFGESI